MNVKLLLLLALSASVLAAPTASAASTEEVCNGEPVVQTIPCSAGFIVKVCGEETLDFCRMI
jgi:hypothetical protein